MHDTYNNIALVIQLKFYDLNVFRVNIIRVLIFPCDFLSKHDSLPSYLTLITESNFNYKSVVKNEFQFTPVKYHASRHKISFHCMHSGFCSFIIYCISIVNTQHM